MDIAAPSADYKLSVDVGDIQTDGRTSLSHPFPVSEGGNNDLRNFAWSL